MEGAGRGLGGGWEEAGRELGGGREEAVRRLGGGWEEAGRGLGGGWGEVGRKLCRGWGRLGRLPPYTHLQVLNARYSPTKVLNSSALAQNATLLSGALPYRTPLSTKYTKMYKPQHETTIPARSQSPKPEPKQPNDTHKVLNLTPMTPDLGLAGVCLSEGPRTNQPVRAHPCGLGGTPSRLYHKLSEYLVTCANRCGAQHKGIDIRDSTPQWQCI